MDDSKNDALDEFLGMETADQYSLTKFMQKQVDNELINTNQSKSTEQVLNDINYAIKAKYQLELNNFDEIGLALLANRANIKVTAKQFKMDSTELRMLIRVEPILNAYWRAAYHEVKALVDDKVIEILEAGEEKDKDILKAVFNKMYAGRKAGGYNINELGAIGYGDQVAVEQQEVIKKDLQDGENEKYNVVIQFNNKQITLNENKSIEAQLLESMDEDAIDADES